MIYLGEQIVRNYTAKLDNLENKLLSVYCHSNPFSCHWNLWMSSDLLHYLRAQLYLSDFNSFVIFYVYSIDKNCFMVISQFVILIY